ncbi:GNAT family N-acetyltransferase [Streptantibioticus silvisoli]|uniref:GNAT family N-acetyltransferase n=1 Tax=Streptantibioticus silvisoli TaxID=2705255 RepID=A0ABT6VX13_9ACTN|nr:GNAT family N-acetyltransferase [Streptantibioticus silvisoli]MDI5963020.1 GNAT family N-acetyltransferase [Streptantibioticus silvisoli]
MTDVCVRLAQAADRPLAERLWLMFRHDMSEFDARLPHPDGTFRAERLHAAFDDADRVPYLLMSGEQPAGFAFVRGLAGPARVMGSFFVVRGARRTGLGLRAAREVVARHPGPWRIAFQDTNAAAVRFWHLVATECAGDAWTEERLPVPDRPELPPDVWISFDTTRNAEGGGRS